MQTRSKAPAPEEPVCCVRGANQARTKTCPSCHNACCRYCAANTCAACSSNGKRTLCFFSAQCLRSRAEKHERGTREKKQDANKHFLQLSLTSSPTPIEVRNVIATCFPLALKRAGKREKEKKTANSPLLPRIPAAR